MSMFFIKLIDNNFNKLYISQKINLFSQSFTAFSFRLEPKKQSIEALFEDFLPELRQVLYESDVLLFERKIKLLKNSQNIDFENSINTVIEDIGGIEFAFSSRGICFRAHPDLCGSDFM
jgi:hypothetical protein